MLFHVRMQVALPHELPDHAVEDLKERERDMALTLQKEGKWRHLWRIAGQYSNVSVFDVADGDELHAILSALPLFPFMIMTVEALAAHPSVLKEQ